MNLWWRTCDCDFGCPVRSTSTINSLYTLYYVFVGVQMFAMIFKKSFVVYIVQWIRDRVWLKIIYKDKPFLILTYMILLFIVCFSLMVLEQLFGTLRKYCMTTDVLLVVHLKVKHEIWSQFTIIHLLFSTMWNV